MKIIVAMLLWSSSCFNGYVGNPRIAKADFGAAAIASGVTDSQEAKQAVVDFLTWYKNHINGASRIVLVNQEKGKPYSVNLKNGERYLTYLKSSNFLTAEYLDDWRQFFKERNEGFRLNPQFEGPPTGFDYDLVMLTQDVDMRLASLRELKIEKVTVSKDRATVKLTLSDVYEFKLQRRNNRWLINEILNLSQE